MTNLVLKFAAAAAAVAGPVILMWGLVVSGLLDERQSLLLAGLVLPILWSISMTLALILGDASAIRARARAFHSWTGLSLSLVIYFVSVTGVIALFAEELHIWESAEARISWHGEWISVDPHIQKLVAKAQTQGSIAFVDVGLPRAAEPFLDLAVRVNGDDGRAFNLMERRNPNTGELIGRSGAPFSAWLKTLHTDLGLQQIEGRTILGISGLLTMTLALLGVAAHPAMFRSLFLWRIDAPWPMRWRDTHHALGVWGVLFLYMMAYTGASLALLKLLIVLVSSINSEGEAKSARDLIIPPIAPAGIDARIADMDELIAKATDYGGVTPLSLKVINWGDRHGRVLVVWEDPEALTRISHMELDAVTGALIGKRPSEVSGFAGRIDAALTPLHYATYGGDGATGLALKGAYGVLGLCLALIAVSGISYWLANRRDLAYLWRLDGICIGYCSGLVAASAVTLFVAKVSNFISVGLLAAPPLTFIGVWLLMFLWGWASTDLNRFNRHCLGVSAFALLGAVAADLALSHITDVLTAHPIAYAVDAGLVLIAGLLSVATVRSKPNCLNEQPLQ